MRALVRAICGAAGIACLAVAAYIAFDWADYGADSTCGNFVHYKGAGPPCSDIMRHRAIGVIVLVAAAVVLVAVGFSTKRDARHG